MVFERVMEMIESGESDSRVAPSSPATGGAGAPSCYRLSVLLGSLEVSARLKTSADLELLIRVLEANKVLFATNEDSSKPKNAAVEASSKLGTPSKKKSLNGKHAFAKADDSEAEILTLS
jgi:hypothetical protein